MWPGSAILAALLRASCLALLLAACSAEPARPHVDPALVRAYAPPGPAGDPWGPIVRDASAESGVPEPLLYAVMWAESRGCQWLNGKPMYGEHGEAGLMQVPPSVYAMIRRHVPIGPDPWVPRDNVRAAAWSLSQFIARYGLPDALAAYEYGPTELDRDRRVGRPLPAETQRYARDVWADARSRAARRASGRRWTDPDRIVCTLAGR